MSIPKQGRDARQGRSLLENLETRTLFAVHAAADPVPPIAATATISGNVFNDANSNATRDPGEAGVANITITLTPLPAASAGAAVTKQTDANGHYVFDGLQPGRYSVKETVPAGSTQTKPAGGYEVTVTAGQTVGDENFGLHTNPVAATAKVSGRVFNDLNNDGVREEGEPGLAGVTVTLSHEGSVQTFVTPAGGEYSFTGLAAGGYTLSQTVLAGYTGTAPAGNKYSLSLGAGQSVTNELFGQHKNEESPKFQIRGKVWNDTDGDGVFDANESVSGVRTVFIDANGNGKLDAGERSTQSNANGEYVLDGLTAGTYNVSRVEPDGYHLSNGTNGGKFVVVHVGAATVSGVNLGSAANNVVPPPPPSTATITGLVWNDTNADGVFEDSESVSGVRTVFIDANGNGKLDDGEKSTQSNAEGRYTFSNLAAGTYRLTRVFPAGYHLSNNKDGFVTVTVAVGQVKSGVNLGSAANT